MKHHRIAAMALAALFGVSAVGCSDGSHGDGNIDGNIPNPGIIQANPLPLVFRDVAVGDSATIKVRVSNSSWGALKITSIELIEDTDDDEGGAVEFRRVAWPETAELREGEFFDLTVVYSPLDQSPDKGRIVIRSNDPEKGEFTIPILAKDSAPNLSVASPIVFQDVDPVTPQTRNAAWRLSEVRNTGDAPLKITDIALVGSLDFSVSYPASLDSTDPSTDAQAAPTLLEPDASFPIRVYFNPLDRRPAAAGLVISSNDPDSPQHTVSLQGNRGEPCIKLNPEDELDFGAGEIGFANRKTITVENCSVGHDLELSSIKVTAAAGVFELDGFSGASIVVLPGESANLALTFTPGANVVSTGELTVESNVPARPILTMSLVGHGVVDLCPQAIALGRLSVSDVLRQYITAVPLKTVWLDGASSMDPGGSIQRFEWSIVQRPVGSTARLEPSNTHPTPSLFLDIAGVYIVELTVYDAQGRASCDDTTGRVVISALPDVDVHIELFWETPGDRLQSDTVGTDLDLHYLHPDGRWNQAPYDVFWRNGTADWGTPGDLDDPSLDVDDTDGLGPEVINHDGPQSGLTYEVGVYYYADKGLGSSYATIRIYIDGVQSYEHLDQYMAKEETFLRAASISWPGGVVQPINEVSDGFPGQ